LADVVQRRGHLDDPDLVLEHAQLLGDQAGDVGHALQIGAGAGVAELDRPRQPRERLALAFLDLVHARQQPLLQRQRALLDVLGLLAQRQQVTATRAQLARAHRLDQEIDHSGLQRGLADRFVADHGDQDDRNVAVHRQPAETAGELQAVDAGHAVIEQQQVGLMALAPGQRRLGLAEIVHLQLGRNVLDDVAQHRPCGRLVIDDNDVHSSGIRREAAPCGCRPASILCCVAPGQPPKVPARPWRPAFT
ncbi:hypothetical protein CATMIT_01993, partial [Catenibacterium mitsuokai DSM 15897]